MEALSRSLNSSSSKLIASSTALEAPTSLVILHFLAIGRRSRFADEEPWTGAVIKFRNGSNDGGSIDGGSEEAMGSCLIILGIEFL